MTLREYLEDYASGETREKGLRLIEEQLEKIPHERVKELVREKLRLIGKGSRDFRI